jgi:HrpA-like RNA helicase
VHTNHSMTYTHTHTYCYLLLGILTKMGTFVAGLGVDLQLGRMIGLGAQFGCLPEVFEKTYIFVCLFMQHTCIAFV